MADGAEGAGVTLRAYQDAQLAAAERRLAERIGAVEKLLERDVAALRTLREQQLAAHEREHAAGRVAVGKADEALTVRLESMNEFRRQLDRERGNYATREQLDDRLVAVVRAIETNGERLALAESALARMGGWIAAASVGLTIAMFVLNRLWH